MKLRTTLVRPGTTVGSGAGAVAEDIVITADADATVGDLARTLTDWRGGKQGELGSALSQALLERAIGVVYRPRSELTSHYFQAVLAEQFDAWVWFEETRAVTPLGHERPHGAPDTWPFGL